MTAITIGIFGQSFAQALAGTAGSGVLREELALAGFSATLVTHAVGGTSALRANAPASMPDGYWWDCVAAAPGPCLAQAMRVIAAAPVKPSVICWLQGEADAIPGTDAAAYEEATLQIVAALKKSCNPADPAAVRVYAHCLGRTLWDCPEVQAIREAQIRVRSRSSVDYLLDFYDLPPKQDDMLARHARGDRHFRPAENAKIGWRAAQTILRDLGQRHAAAPRVSRVTRRDANALDITITAAPPQSTDQPLHPAEWALRTPGNRLFRDDELVYRWIGPATLRIAVPAGETIPDGSVLLYPYGDLRRIDQAGIIRDSIDTPLASLALTVPPLPVTTATAQTAAA